MKTGRADLDAMVRVTSIPAEEPTFLLRGQDVSGPEAVRAWAEFSLAAGAPVAVIEQALKQADAMAAWPVKKVPDGSHLTTNEALQLKFEFSRRRWQVGHRDPAYMAAAAVHAGQLAQLQPLIDLATTIAGLPTNGQVLLHHLQIAARKALLDARAAGLIGGGA